MATPLVQPALASGEVAPSVYGRIDIDRERIAASTERNAFVNVRGGASSRAGTRFVGFSKQTGRGLPPRLLTFQFNINQGLALEFGHQYMRVVDDGAFVTENPVAIGGATQADPCVLTFGAQGATAATPNVGAVTFSYAPGDKITLMGGTALTPAVLQVTSSRLVSILANARGTGYVVADTITLGGGTFSAAAVVTVATVVSVQASGSITFSANPADGDTVTLNAKVWTFKTTPTAAAQTQIQSTLAGTLVQLAADLNASADVLLTPATYSSNATQLIVTFDVAGAGGNAYTLAASVGVVSGATLTGGTASGLGTVNVTTPGTYTALPANANMTQTATSGAGAGASFQTAVFGPRVLSIFSPGAYSVVPGNPVAQASTDGIGQGATFTMTWAATPAFANDDWVEVSDVQGMTELNGNTYVLRAVTATTAQLFDVYGDPVDATTFGAYTGGGLVRRIYTVDTPYDEQDLAWLKITQSADVMTICCVNQETLVEYTPQNLSRASNTDWTFSDVVAVPSVSPPATATATISGTGTTFYQYTVTAVAPSDGSESVASPIASVTGVSISTQQGQVNLSWTAVPEVNQYNIYKAQPSFGSAVPVGAQFGYLGSAYGTSFKDTNIVPDFTQVPPRHYDPFARGQIAGVNIVTGGSGYTSQPTATITTSTGSGAKLSVVVQNGAVVAVIIEDSGHDYADTDTIAFTGGGGSGATATLTIGAHTGTYPSVPGYFQQRRAFANSLNQPDTYWMSQIGAYDNFDARLPPIVTDAVTGSPWAVQVDGIQWLVQITSGLLVFTGQAAWVVVGSGSFATNAQEFGPGSQTVTPQPFTGCSPTIPPIKINFDIIYVTAKGSFYYDLPYQQLALSEPIDLTQYSTHLFVGYTVLEHAWCEQPYKLLWSVRDDGTMLSETFLKAEQLAGWTRHDTNGLYCSVCSVTEPPVDALYMATQRFPDGHDAYMIERMDNRIWNTVEDVWAVDCGLSLPQPTPNATLTADSAYGIGNLSGVTDLVPGQNYSAFTTADVIDDNGEGPGIGAVAQLTIVGGQITNVTFSPQGSGYVSPKLVITDPTNAGEGGSATVVLNSTATFTASTPVFDPSDVGSVIRMGGGIATINAYVNPQVVTALVHVPINAVMPNSSGRIRPQPAGTWTMTEPVSTVSGLGHLAGETVTGLADGNVITPRVVSPTGEIPVDVPASSIVVGLGFQAQVQSVYADAGSPTIQGQRKKIGAVSALIQNSRGVKIGANQPDGSTLSPPQIAPEWPDMQETERPQDTKPKPYNSDTEPLRTGWVRVPTPSGWQKEGQAAFEQSLPLPMNILSLVPELLGGDTPSQSFPQRGGQPG
jgi:hypothetical protein